MIQCYSSICRQFTIPKLLNPRIKYHEEQANTPGSGEPVVLGRLSCSEMENGVHGFTTIAGEQVYSRVCINKITNSATNSGLGFGVQGLQMPIYLMSVVIHEESHVQFYRMRINNDITRKEYHKDEVNAYRKQISYIQSSPSISGIDSW
jgi:hypothetical protein